MYPDWTWTFVNLFAAVVFSFLGLLLISVVIFVIVGMVKVVKDGW